MTRPFPWSKRDLFVRIAGRLVEDANQAVIERLRKPAEVAL